MIKITVIGTGSVGSTIAYTLASKSVASELVMIDINEQKALGEAMDIRQGMPFCGPVKIYAGAYADAKNSNIVILTSGVARKPGQSRLDLAQTNVNIAKQIMPEIVKYAPDAIYIIVSNPVDIITYLFAKQSGIPENRVIGSGTILDTARLRSRLAEYYSINQQNIHAYVLGEHGDSSFVPWSLATISDVPIAKFASSLSGCSRVIPELDYDGIETYMHKSGGKVIARKGATFYAVSLAVVHICQCIINGMDTSLTVSSMMHGEYGIDDICLSSVCMVGKDGLSGKILAPLTDEEIGKMRSSAETLRAVIRQVQL